MISAKIVADSLNEFGNRITTMVLVFPRIVLAEFNTHRMLSRNSASSRAIPFHKMLRSVADHPFMPLKWQKDHSGMQGTEYLDEHDSQLANQAWLKARDYAIQQAKELNGYSLAPGNTELKVTKQVCNRLLEPFLYHTALVTATEWQNFFALRAHPAAEIHIAKLAELMLEEMNFSTPKKLKAGEWHIPFGDKFNETNLFTMIEADHGVYDPILKYQELHGGISKENQATVDKYKVKIAIARCARVSYNNFEGNDDYAADVKLHDRLAESGHWSPFEHCAKAMEPWEYEQHRLHYLGDGMRIYEEGWSGNFRGFVAYRKMMPNENKYDSRLLQK